MKKRNNRKLILDFDTTGWVPLRNPTVSKYEDLLLQFDPIAKNLVNSEEDQSVQVSLPMLQDEQKGLYKSIESRYDKKYSDLDYKIRLSVEQAEKPQNTGPSIKGYLVRLVKRS